VPSYQRQIVFLAFTAFSRSWPVLSSYARGPFDMLRTGFDRLSPNGTGARRRANASQLLHRALRDPRRMNPSAGPPAAPP
jgi:hypothetical protein